MVRDRLGKTTDAFKPDNIENFSNMSPSGFLQEESHF